MAKRRANIRDVARKAGVSIATVSRILNGSGSFSPRTVASVRKAVNQLGYRRSTGSIVRPRAGSPSVALVIPDVDLVDPHTWDVIRGLYDTASLQTVGVSLRVFRGQVDDGAGLDADVSRSGAAGVLFVPGVATASTALAASTTHLPLVFLERTLPNRTESASVADTAQGAYQAARYLLELGHRDVLYLAGPQELSTERDKSAGLHRALAEAGLRPAADGQLDAGFERVTAREVLGARLKRGRDFSAVFAASDLLAFGAKEALDQAGLVVGRDVSLMGFGNIPFAAALGLTTVEVLAYEMGRNALLELLELLSGRREEPRRQVVTTGLVIRSSCRRNSAP